MPTIKIKSSHPSQGDFVIINAADFDAEKHEPFDQESYDALRGAVQSGGLLPSAPEVLAARDQLLARSDELDDRELQINQRALSLDDREQQLLEREQANATEAQRLADLAAARAVAPDYSAMSKDELHAALNVKGTQFPAAANKAELIALLTAA
jgi:hypothetical protein